MRLVPRNDSRDGDPVSPAGDLGQPTLRFWSLHRVCFVLKKCGFVWTFFLGGKVFTTYFIVGFKFKVILKDF